MFVDVLCAVTAGWILYQTDYGAPDVKERRSLLDKMSSRWLNDKIDHHVEKKLNSGGGSSFRMGP